MQLVPGVDVADVEMEQYFDLYRSLHEHPELSMQEYRTADVVTERLKAAGAETFACGQTGVVGILRNGPGETIAFRADLDGLPIAEETGVWYASKAVGTLADGSTVPVMHGCGHDAHVACAVAAFELLAAHPTIWTGTVVFVFQPGEETAAGSAEMVDDGLWVRAPIPRVVLGQHVGPYRAGTVQTRRGDAMSLADSWRVTVHGRGAHGSQPEAAIDPIVVAAYMITRLQTVVSRELVPQEAVVVTVGTFHSGLKENVIPSEAVYTLNIRTPDEMVRERVLDSVRRIIVAEASASGAPEPTITELYRFPRCYNHPDETAVVSRAIAAVLGEENVSLDRPRSMGSEDFGWLGESIGVPTVFWWFGGYASTRWKAGEALPGNHSSHFAPDVEPTVIGGARAALAAILSYLAVGGVSDER